MKRISILLLVFFVIALIGCSGATASDPKNLPGKVVQVNSGSYRDVTVAELQDMLKNKDFELVNVHIPFEGNLPGTDLSIPYDQITLNRDKLPGKDAKIVLYCRSGRMSQIAATDLANLGYTNLWNLSGGMAAWEQAGGKIER